MAYQTGTATSTSDLLDKLRAFLAANGWTVTWRFQIAQGTWRWLHVTKGGLFFNFWEQLSSINTSLSPPEHNILCNYATSYNASAEPFAQTGANNSVGATGCTPPYLSYHFHEGTGASGPYCFGAIEVSSGEFAHFGVGILNKAGAYTGGEFTCGSMWALTTVDGVGTIQNPISDVNAWPFSDSALWSRWGGNLPVGTVVRCPAALSGTHVVANRAAPIGQQLRVGGARDWSTDRNITGSPMWLVWRQPTIPAIAAAVLMRCHCFVERPSSLFSYIGEPPGIRHVSMEFLNPGDEIVLGPETWKCFPARRKGSGSEIPLSGNVGIAYLKN